jgi:hypothetical protein
MVRAATRQRANRPFPDDLALTDPHQWLMLIGFGLAWLALTGLAVSVGLLLAAWRGAFR